MRRFLSGRVDAFGALGQAAADLARAEGRALSAELRGSGRKFLGALLLLALALFTLFWALGALVFSAIELVSLWLPRWGAALSVLAVLVLAAALLAAIGWGRLRRLETPSDTLRRRVQDHRDWWEQRISSGAKVRSTRSGDGGEGSAGPGDPGARTPDGSSD